MDADKLKRLRERAAQAETEIQILVKKLEKLKSAKPVSSPEDDEGLLAENAKLKYRLNILKRAHQDTECPSSGNTVKKSASDKNDGMLNISAGLEKLFAAAIAKAFPGLKNPPPVAITIATQAKFGDYQYNGAMALSGILKSSGGGQQPQSKPMNPREVAQAIVQSIPENPFIEQLELAGPGFVNIRLKTSLIRDQLAWLVLEGVRPPGSIEPKRVVVDFSSPNIAKEMHVGHLRSTIIGDSICRLLEFLGHDVVRLNHVGDWGTQFGMLLAHLEDRYPDFATRTPPIGDLQTFYKESKVRFDSDEQFKKRAYSCVVKLQAHNPDYIKGWKAICDVSRKEFQKIYDRLDIVLVERGESFYQDLMNEAVALMEAANTLEVDDGRKIMFAPGLAVPLTVVKSDGGYTYDTSDMATIRQRINDERADWIIYVTDAGQAGHFDLIFGCAERLGWLDRSRVRVDHVGFGVVLGEDRKKFKSRSSDTVRLVDLLDEGLRRAKETLIEKGRDKVLTEQELDAAMNSVAYGCIKYSDLAHNRNNEYVFSFDKMLEDKGNTAVYLLYAYTRIRSIIRAANVSLEDIKQAARSGNIPLGHEKELKLAKTLLRFPETVVRLTSDLCLHPLCEYLYEVSTTFTEFYDSCYCVEKDRATGAVARVNMDRLALCEATASVMAQCFALLGLKPVEKM